MTKILDIEDDDSPIDSKEFMELVTQDTKGQPESGETETELLEVSGADKQAWLLKVPDFLIRHFNAFNQDGANVGTVRVHATTKQYQLILSEEAAESIPQVYDLTFHPERTSNTFVFGEPNAATGDAASICATIVNEGNVLPPPGDPSYRQILRKREERRRSTKTLEENITGRPSTETVGGMFMPGLARPKAFIHKTADPKQTKGGKRARVPHNELMDDVFAAFAQYPYWSKKALVEQFYVPWAQLKEMMDEVCSYHSQGEYIGNYSLKPHLSGRFEDSVSATASAYAASPQQYEADAGSTSIETVREEDRSDLTDEEELEEYEACLRRFLEPWTY